MVALLLYIIGGLLTLVFNLKQIEIERCKWELRNDVSAGEARLIDLFTKLLFVIAWPIILAAQAFWIILLL